MESRLSIIDLDALYYNLSVVRQKVGSTKIMPIIKANAYGHGLVPIAQALERAGVDALGVALIQEAIELRKHGISIPILALGSIVQEQIPLYFNYNIDIMAASEQKVELIESYAERYKTCARIHLKLDTGLGRIGLRAHRAPALFEKIIRSRFIELVGIASHFATADEQDTRYMHDQLSLFLDACSFFERHHIPMPIRHIANSGAILQCPASYLDMVRPGIMLYGVYPASWMKSYAALKQVLTLKAKVVYFKAVSAGQSISYGRTWKASDVTRIVTLPIGYGDGYPRALSNRASVLHNGKRYPVVGTICMDQLMVNIGTDSLFNGEEMTLIGRSGSEEITINELADLYGGSPYELLVSMNNRVLREYKQCAAFDQDWYKQHYTKEDFL